MKRRYLCVAVSIFAAGILSFNMPYNLFWIVFTLFLTFGIFFLIKSKRVYLIILGAMFLTGGLYGNFTQNQYKHSPLYEYTQKPCSGKMFVKEVQTKTEDFVTVKAVVTEVDGKKANETIIFTIYNLSDVKVNTVIHFDELKFKIPERERNSGGFNYNRYLKSKGIYFTASAAREKLATRGRDGFFILRALRTFKQQIDYRSQTVFGQNFARQMMPAFLVGNDISLSPEVDYFFKKAGITHILVASGMHVTVVMALCAILLYPLRRKKFIYNLLSWVVILAFGGLVGLHPSIVRAIAAYFMYFVAKNTLRSADQLTILFEAAFVILMINPLSIYDLSFLLSFGAVFGIIIFTPPIIRSIKWFVYTPHFAISLVDALPYKVSMFVRKKLHSFFNMIIVAAAVSVAAQIGVFPVMVATFNGAAVLSLFVNVVISLLTPFLYFFGIVALITNVALFSAVTEFLCKIFLKGAIITASIPGNNMSLPSSDLITGAVVLFVICLVIRCKTKWFDKLFTPLAAVCVILSLVGCVTASYIPKNKAIVTFLNVEQGDCAVIRLNDNKTIVIDTGTENMCSYELLPYLTRSGISKIDALILSHSDSDHSGGADLLIQSVEVEKVITSTFFDSKIEGAVHTTLSEGEKFDIGNAKFTVISPSENGDYSSKNDSSLVVKMDFGESSFLFTGDMGLEVENALRNVDADVLKVSHHGSKTASGEEFVKRVSPLFAVISVDKDNSYGHPDSGVIKTLENENCEILRTDRDYTITFKADLNGDFALTKGL